MPATTTRQSAASSSVAHGHQPVQAGDADVVDAVDAGAERAGDERRLGGDRSVGGAGRDDATVPRGPAAVPTATARATSSTSASGNAARTAAAVSSGTPGRQRGPVAVLAGQRAQDRDGLLGRLAGGVHDLGVAGAQAAVGVDPGEAEVERAVHRAGGEALDRRLDGDAAGRHVAQQRVSSARSMAGNLVPVACVSPARRLEDTRAQLVDRDLPGRDARRPRRPPRSACCCCCRAGPAAGARRRVRRLGGRAGGHPRPPAPTRGALRHVAVVRYDAFGDMGGRLSFSAALLDDRATGWCSSRSTGGPRPAPTPSRWSGCRATTRSRPRSRKRSRPPAAA